MASGGESAGSKSPSKHSSSHSPIFGLNKGAKGSRHPLLPPFIGATSDVFLTVLFTFLVPGILPNSCLISTNAKQDEGEEEFLSTYVRR